MTIKVYELIGENGVTLEDGQKVYDTIFPKLQNNESVELDFEDVVILASPFLNGAIGQLLKDFSSEQLNRLLNLTHLPPTANQVLRRVIANAKEYYGNDEIRQAVDNAVGAQSEES